jgi:hypothetical protein
VRDTAIEGMKDKFTQLTSIDEKSSVDHLAKVYSVVTRFADLEKLMVQNDMDNVVFTVPSEFVDNDSGEMIPSSSAVPIKLFSESNTVDMETGKRANAYFLKFGTEYHGENVVWSGQKILNSCDQALRDKLVESTRGWALEHQGGPTYLKLLLGL